MEYFRKINLQLKPFDFDSLKGNMTHQYISGDVAISYYAITNMRTFKEYHVLDRNFGIQPSYVLLVEITGEGTLHPHKDHGVTTAINYYIDPADCITKYYCTKDTATPRRYRGEQAANVYSFDDIEYACEFNANTSEAYLMRLNQVHSVHKDSNDIRRFVAYHWVTNTYDQVLNSLLI